MRLHVQAGNAAAALRVFANCREQLRDELGASPSPDIERLHLAVLRGKPIPADRDLSAARSRRVVTS